MNGFGFSVMNTLRSTFTVMFGHERALKCYQFNHNISELRFFGRENGLQNLDSVDDACA